ncbi:MAG: 16S rRNA (adenine(1518)-N(6)/adenine(1519)-N(6))-dimethyltransferase RsmA [Acidimicrobiales bacterium]
MTLTRREAVALLERHGLSPSRALGQNFLVDPNTVRKIVRLARVGPGDPVVEIGAGLGALTVELADAGTEVVAVEIDRHLLPALREVVEPHGVTVVAGDALALDWAEVLAGHDRWSLVANLPYNVATPLVCDLLDDVPAIDRMLIMVQREVGERLAAGPGDAAYGIPSVKVAYWATTEVVGRVPPTVFLPQPKVESALVAITRRPAPAVGADPERLFGLVRTAFGQRRKMLRRSLAGVVTPEMFEQAGIRPEARPEELGILEWGALTDVAGPQADPRAGAQVSPEP